MTHQGPFLVFFLWEKLHEEYPENMGMNKIRLNFQKVVIIATVSGHNNC